MSVKSLRFATPPPRGPDYQAPSEETLRPFDSENNPC